jgi:hypothetical protein
MKNRASFYSSFIACLCLLTNVYALANNVSVQQSEQGISYITGGISEDEADALKRYVKQFNLRVIFSEGASGRSITDVNVSIYNTQGQLVFSVNEAQPQLMLNLPNGTYTIGALYNGDKQSHKFTISSDKQKKIILNWKNVTDEDAMEENDRSSS